MKKNNVKKVVKDGKTVLVCGNCGAELQGLAEHEHVACGRVIGKDSGLGTIVMPAVGGGKAEPSTAPSGGVDMAQMMAVLTQFMKMVSGNPDMKEMMISALGVGGSKVEVKAAQDAEPSMAPSGEMQESVADMVIKARDAMESQSAPWSMNFYHNRMVRQMFEDFGLGYKAVKDDKYRNGERMVRTWTLHMKELGFWYMWEQLDKAMYMMSICERLDPDEYVDMCECYRDNVAKNVAQQWFDEVVAWVEGSCKIKRGKRVKDGVVEKKGEYYDTAVFGTLDKKYEKGVFVDEFDEVKATLKAKVDAVETKDARARYEAVHELYGVVRSIGIVGELCEDFVDAFKKWGSYCVMQNLIMHRGVRMYESIVNGCNSVEEGENPMNEYKSLVALKNLLGRKSGAHMLGILCLIVEANGYDHAAYRDAFLASKHK